MWPGLPSLAPEGELGDDERLGSGLPNDGLVHGPDVWPVDEVLLDLDVLVFVGMDVVLTSRHPFVDVEVENSGHGELVADDRTTFIQRRPTPNRSKHWNGRVLGSFLASFRRRKSGKSLHREVDLVPEKQ